MDFQLYGQEGMSEEAEQKGLRATGVNQGFPEQLALETESLWAGN